MKKFSKSSMDNLLGGLIGESENQEEQPEVTPSANKEEEPSRRGRPSTNVKKEAVTTIIPEDLMGKVRAIGDREDLTLTDLFTVALKKLVREYEDKNGTVRVRKQKKKDVSDVFDI